MILTGVSKIVKACSKEYLVFNTALSVGELEATCKAQNATSLTIESMDELTCLLGLAAGDMTHEKFN